MPQRIDYLPLDVFHYIGSYLDVDDYVSAAQCNRQIRALLASDATAKVALQTSVPTTREAALSLREDQSSRSLLRDIYSCRSALKTGSPFSVTVLGYGLKACHSSGNLCYFSNEQVRILNVPDHDSHEIVIDIRQLVRGITRLQRRTLEDFKLEVLSCEHDVLVVSYEEADQGERWLAALDISSPDDIDAMGLENRIRFRKRLTNAPKLFARQDGHFVFYGTHSGRGSSHNHHEWEIQGVNLKDGNELYDSPLQLSGFVGSEIDVTACFSVHGGTFCAVSNQTSFDVEEVDWTSFYHVVLISVDDIVPDVRLRKIWRRQHKEGPINDSWTEMTLQRDPGTNELLIVECRKEWLDGGSSNIRTYYQLPITFDELEDADNHGYPVGDPLASTVDEKSRPNYCPPKKRLAQHVHPEAESGATTSKEFILARTKFRAYNAASSSFIDLINNPIRQPGSFVSKDRLKLRIASRSKRSPLEDDPSQPGRTRLRMTTDHKGRAVPHESFTPTETFLWPSDDAPRELHELLTQGQRLPELCATADERSIIYSVKATGRQDDAIMMISFDRNWHPAYLKALAADSADAEMKVDSDVLGPSSQSTRDRRQNGAAEPQAVPTTLESAIRRESAMHLRIQQGYWLR